VIGSVLSSRYQGTLSPALAGRPIPAAAAHAILGSIGGALTVAGVAGRMSRLVWNFGDGHWLVGYAATSFFVA
jgi:hypothetical protein